MLGANVVRLSPRSLALGHLIDMFCSYRAEPELSFPLEARQHLAIVLLEEVNGGVDTKSILEPTCAATIASLKELPRTFVQAFHQRLLDTSEPDDIWTLMTSLSDILEKPSLDASLSWDAVMEGGNGPMHLDRASVLGIFSRRLLLSFRQSTFETLCTLTTQFQQWVRASPPTTEIKAPNAEGDTAPPWAHSLPLKQLEARVNRLVNLVEGGTVLELADLQPQVEQLRMHAAQLPQVHYLQMLLHVHERSFDQASSLCR